MIDSFLEMKEMKEDRRQMTDFFLEMKEMTEDRGQISGNGV